MANQYWNNKVVLITGGSSGIGLAAAKQLASAGAHVWLAARRLELLEPALKEVQAARRDPSQICGIVSADVSDYKQAARIVETVTKSAGVPDVLINSAGISQPGYVQELSPEVFEHLMQVNYLGTVYVTAAVLPAHDEARLWPYHQPVFHGRLYGRFWIQCLRRDEVCRGGTRKSYGQR